MTRRDTSTTTAQPTPGSDAMHPLATTIPNLGTVKTYYLHHGDTTMLMSQYDDPNESTHEIRHSPDTPLRKAHAYACRHARRLRFCMAHPDALENLFRTAMDGHGPEQTLSFIRSVPGLEAVIREAVAMIKTWQHGHPDSIASRIFESPPGGDFPSDVPTYGPAVIDVTLFWNPRTDDPEDVEFGDSPPLGLTLDIPRHPDFYTRERAYNDEHYFREIKEPALEELEKRLNALFVAHGFGDTIDAGLYY